MGPGSMQLSTHRCLSCVLASCSFASRCHAARLSKPLPHAAAWRIRRCIAAAVPGVSEQTAEKEQQPQQQTPPGHQSDAIYYSNYPLDRGADLRHDPVALSELFGSAWLLPVAGSKLLVQQRQRSSQQADEASTAQPTTSSVSYVIGSSSNGDAKLALAWIQPASEAAHLLDPSYPPMFLGLDSNGVAYFAGQMQAGAVDGLAASRGAVWEVARSAGPDLPDTEASLAAVASGLAQFHRANMFSGSSGQPMESRQGGFARAEPGSRRAIYPRIDPAIITLITAGDWCLLGRKAGWPSGRYSTLAGFSEIGETLEQALCREVEEESAVRVDPSTVRYVASQPWPFPSSLMVAFYAEAALEQAAATNSSNGTSRNAVDLLKGPGRSAALDTGIWPEEVAQALLPVLPPAVPQADEMEDVRWFHRDWLQQALSTSNASPGAFNIPSSYSLAHRLIMGWLPQKQQGGNASADAWEAARTLLPQVSIDEGTFKYVLLRLSDNTGRSRLLVWGHAAAGYHNDILQRCKAEACRMGLDVDVLGGGRINHDRVERKIDVYGYSAAFGPAPHEVSAALLRRWHPFYEPQNITVSYDGY